MALVGADAEFSVLALEGARENAKKHGIRIVYDRTYPPNTVEFGTIVRSIKSTNPDLVFIASYPPDFAGMIRSIHEVKLGAKMVGGGMIGLQFSALKTQLGPLLNNIVCYDLYAPEPTMIFPGVEQFLVRYRERAGAAGVDPLGLYIPPYAYAEMQILEAGDQFRRLIGRRQSLRPRCDRRRLTPWPARSSSAPKASGASQGSCSFSIAAFKATMSSSSNSRARK